MPEHMLLGKRELRRLEAKAYASKWLFGNRRSRVPARDFVVAVEKELPLFHSVAGQVEYFDGAQGGWTTQAGESRLRAEEVTKALDMTFDKLVVVASERPTSHPDGPGLELVPKQAPFDDSCFRNSTFLEALVRQARTLIAAACRPSSVSAETLSGLGTSGDGLCLDFLERRPRG